MPKKQPYKKPNTNPKDKVIRVKKKSPAKPTKGMKLQTPKKNRKTK